MTKKRARHLTSRDFQSAESWTPLQHGDIVDLVAPGSACEPESLRKAAQFIKSMGLVPRYPKNIFKSKSPILSSTDENRYKILKNALLAKDSKVVWCVRGGYGSIRLLPELTKLQRPAKTKLLVGYSDITTLHSYVNFFWRWPSLHGPLLDRFASNQHQAQELKLMWGMLFGHIPEVAFSKLKALNSAAKKAAHIRSTVVGGNLAVLQSSLATPWQVNPENKILFLEDIGEKAHRVDRMLTQLTQAGYFSKAKAVIFGDMVLANDHDRKMIWNLAIKPWAESQKIPVLSGLPCGHGSLQIPLPFFTSASLKLNRADGELIVHSGYAESK